MKPIKILILLIIPFLFITSVDAEVVTYPRTDDNLGISSDIEVTEENKPFILNTPKVDASTKIYDFADLFTDGEEQLLYQYAINYISNSSYDLAIITINDNPKTYYNGQNPTLVYADDFHDYNDFKNDGVVFIIDTDNREFALSTSYNAQIMYDDYRINHILDVAGYYISEGSYYAGTSTVIGNLENYYKSGVPSSNANCRITEEGDYVCYTKVPYLLVGIISLVITVIIMTVTIKSYKKIKTATDADQYMMKNNTKITTKSDEFIRSNTFKVRRASSSSSSGSSFSSRGGTSTRGSSSGHSHGGGSRRF